MEGIGYDFIPRVLDRSVVHEWVKTSDQPSFLLARRLIREEGLLVVGSSGSTMYAALQKALRLRKGQNCVVVLADGVRNYMTKFVDDRWMRDNGFFRPRPLPGQVRELVRETSEHPLVVAADTQTVHTVIETMRDKGISQLPVTGEGVLVGIVSEAELMEFLGSGDGDGSSLVSECMNRHVAVVGHLSPLTALQESLRTSTAVVVVNDSRQPVAILTRIDLLHFLDAASSKSSSG